ncbi:hypothetical protein Tco_0410027 [Tanacetum coccineum]
MASSRSSSSLESEVDSCSKTCVKAYASLKEQYDNLSFDYKKSQFKLVSYKADIYKLNLEKAEAERDQLKQTLEKFQNSSKSLNEILECQVIDKFKKGLGYDAATAASPAVEVESNTVRRECCPPINKELVSDGKKKIVVHTIPKVDVVRPKQQEKPVRKTGNPETKLEDLVRLNSPKDEKRPGAELTQQNDKSRKLMLIEKITSEVNAAAKINAD